MPLYHPYHKNNLLPGGRLTITRFLHGGCAPVGNEKGLLSNHINWLQDPPARTCGEKKRSFKQ